ncbi:RDD family protein [Campylobacter geochelonis]|uniref:RDD protein n=1 Tax=Campylobacter geochelonis TaxID=1780362 RepID=A0A128EIU7_9BACT|nr:RDD family protein [Campylobacter geochelonis]QKF70895.1 RDD family membrane protein [Campylobacter geochelonis]CZE47942.1 RDD protein [Campylobacter geochelonis]CZE48909.1 RDD protein [Campylobacter geochelonis]
MNFENVKLASINKRGLAFFVDEILTSFLFIIIYYDKIFSATTQEEAIVIASSLSFQYVILKVIYQSFFIWYYGATIGKMIFKIRCVSYENQNPNLSNSVLRAMVRIISEAVFYIGFIWAYFNPARQTWHDKVAKTLVVDIA